MVFESRRGMSPLIATVLLMAFAVALGGMIMNWSSDVGAEAAVDCSTVKVDATQFCSDEQAIRIHARNVGEETIASLTLKVASGQAGEFSISIQNSALRKGESVDSSVPFLVAPDATVSLTASVGEKGAETLCPSAQVTRQPLPKC